VARLAVNLTTTSATERICAILVALSDRFGVSHEDGVLIDLQLTNAQLAAICGVSRQFTNATLQALRARGLVVGSAGLVITDRPALERMAYGH
jgi:CRP-like cAMP-binding protein